MSAATASVPQTGLAGETLLKAEHLQVRYGDYLAVRDASLTVKRNQVHGLIGPNGAGKSTCFHAITGFVKPTAGHVWFEGEDLVSLPPWQRARRGLVRSYQISAVFPQLSALDNVRAAVARRERRTDHLWQPSHRAQAVSEEALALLRRTGLAREAQRPAGTLAYGQKRALEIATTLALRPVLMLLDEPTAGMAEADVERTTELLESVAVDQTMLMVEHNLRIVERLCDEVTVLQAGEVIACGSYAQISQDARVRSAYLGRSAR